MRCSKLCQVIGIIQETSELLIMNVAFEFSLIKNVRFLIKPPFSESRNLSDPAQGPVSLGICHPWQCQQLLKAELIGGKPVSLELQEVRNANMRCKVFFLGTFFPSNLNVRAPGQMLTQRSPSSSMLLCAELLVGTIQSFQLLHWQPATNLRVTPNLPIYY